MNKQKTDDFYCDLVFSRKVKVNKLKETENILAFHHKKRYSNLFREFNEQKTPEARFLKEIDKLEMAFQAFEYEQKRYPSHLFDEFWENSEKYLRGGKLEYIFRELEMMRKKL